jgi:hypothetical protein
MAADRQTIAVALIRAIVCSSPLKGDYLLLITMTYWHPHALRHPMREVAARYPITYRRVGEKVEALGLDSSGDSYRIMVAILAAMPPHVIPYSQMGDDTPWGEIDWSGFLEGLAAKEGK